jgi:Trypsin-co-occurring domain 1
MDRQVSQIIKLNSSEGPSVLVEVDDEDPGKVMRGARPAEAVIEAGASLEQMLASLGPAIKGIVSQVRASAGWPDETEIEFGVKLSADANVIIARTSGEANFTIALRWSAQRGESSDASVVRAG